MARRKIKPEEADTVIEGLSFLTDILLEVGIVELRISKKDAEIFWDTEGGGMVDPDALSSFFGMIEKHYFERLMKNA